MTAIKSAISESDKHSTDEISGGVVLGSVVNATATSARSQGSMERTNHGNHATYSKLRIDESLNEMQIANFDATAIANASGTVSERSVYDANGVFFAPDATTSRAMKGKAWIVNHKGLRLDAGTEWYENRNRTYSPTMMRFAQEEPTEGIPYIDGQDLFVVCESNPITRKDPTGRISVDTIRNDPSNGGSFLTEWNYWLDKPAPTGGYIVQKVITKGEVRDAAGHITNLDVKPYWEAFYVQPDHRMTDGTLFAGYSDLAARKGTGGTAGSISQTGELKFYSTCGDLGAPLPMSDPPIPTDPNSGFYPYGSINHVPNSGSVPSTFNEPGWWKNNSDNNEAPATRSLSIVWNDIPGEPNFNGTNNKGVPDVTPEMK